MLDIYLHERAGKPQLSIDIASFSKYWDVIQEFSSKTGVSFDFYSDFMVTDQQCEIFAGIFDASVEFKGESNVKVLHLYALLWKAIAKGMNLIFVGD